MTKPIRKVRHSGGNIIGTFPSVKNGGGVPYESTIERDACYLLELAPQVLSYSAQPFTIVAPFEDGKIREYAPDYEVTCEYEVLLLECKPEGKLEDENTQRQVAIGEAWCSENEHRFVLVTGEELRRGPLLENAKVLYRYARVATPPAVSRRAGDILAEASSRELPLGILAERLTKSDEIADASISPADALRYTYSMVFRHVLAVDLTLPITHNSPLRLAAGIEGEKEISYGAMSLR